MQKIILDTRLSAASEFVPEGAILADIGSDHAYLPIYLALKGKISRGLASDINDGPVLSAEKNIAANKLSDKISAQKADGLDGVKKFSPDCITILGMGGELIAKILSRAPWVKDPDITLILQPMTHGEILSEYLTSEGFEITGGKIVRDGQRDDRIYRIIVAKYTGKSTNLTHAEHFVGRENLVCADEVTKIYIKRVTNMYKTKRDGKISGGLDVTLEEKIIAELEKYI